MKIKNFSLTMLCLVSLLTSCGSSFAKELTKKEIMNFIKNIDNTYNYNYSSTETTILSFEVEASEEYLKQIKQTQEELYESYYNKLQFYEFKSQSPFHPEIGVKYFDEISNARIYDPTNLSEVSAQIDYCLDDWGYKFYLDNDCLVEIIPMVLQPNSSYDKYEQFFGEIDMMWISEAKEDDLLINQVLKVEQDGKVSIALTGYCEGYRGDIEYILKIDETSNKIEKFDIVSHNETQIFFGEEEELIVEDYLNGYDLESGDIELDHVAGVSARFTLQGLEEGINAAIKNYKENKENIVWEPLLEVRQDYSIERHIDKEGLISVFNESRREDYYQRGVWCYSIKLETNTNLFDHKWVDEEIQ